MPRCYFHVRDEEDVSIDTEGKELLDLKAAKQEARANARDLIIDCWQARKDTDRRILEIAGANGSIIESV